MSVERVLVTGGAGFLGSHVVRALVAEGATVCSFDAVAPSAACRFVLGDHAREVDAVIGSTGDPDGLARELRRSRSDRIVHLAGVVDPVSLFHDPPAALSNVAGTVNVLEAARVHDVAHVVNFSSIGVLPRVIYEPIDADHPVIVADGGPASGAYGAAKLAGEAFCFAYADAFQLDVRIVRPSAVYGLGMKDHSANLMKNIVEPAVRGEPVALPSGGPLPRDYTHASDVASLVVALGSAPHAPSRVFYAATGRPLVTAAQVDEITRGLVADARITIADVLTDDDRIELGFRGRLSIDDARTQLGWEPRYLDVADGIAEYIDRYRAFLGRA